MMVCLFMFVSYLSLPYIIYTTFSRKYCVRGIRNETKALEGYKDELKPVFKSTPTQFQTVQRTIERDLSALQKKGILKHEGKDNDGKWVISE